jgi:hypothetical protein
MERSGQDALLLVLVGVYVRVLEHLDHLFGELSERHRRLGRLFSPNVRSRTIRSTSLPVITAP